MQLLNEILPEPSVRLKNSKQQDNHSYFVVLKWILCQLLWVTSPEDRLYRVHTTDFYSESHLFASLTDGNPRLSSPNPEVEGTNGPNQSRS